MLIFKRKIGEKIVIGQNVVITLEEVNADEGSCRLSMDSPKSVQFADDKEWRYESERFHIQDVIFFTIIEISGRDMSVRIGIEAPRIVPIDRWEIRQEKLTNRNRKEAASYDN